MTEDISALQERVAHLEAENAELRIRLETAEEESLDLRDKAYVNEMTGLPNRRAFDQQLSVCATDNENRGQPIAMLVVDLRDLTGINDRHGYAVADNVLRHLARKLRMALRSDDHVLIARIGGDEFGILLRTETLLLEELEIIAKRIYMVVCSEQYRIRGEEGKSVPIQISIGGCLRILPVDDIEDFYAIASGNNIEAKRIYKQGEDVGGNLPIVITR